MFTKLSLDVLVSLIAYASVVESPDTPIVARVNTMSLKTHMHQRHFHGEMESLVVSLLPARTIAAL
jgi:hypothetical protein